MARGIKVAYFNSQHQLYSCQHWLLCTAR